MAVRQLRQRELFAGAEAIARGGLAAELADFRAFGTATRLSTTIVAAGGRRVAVPTFANEFWTSGQRQGHSLHEVSYRACFKPELPRFFVERLTRRGDVVHDPFLGRGTTPLEAALLGRTPWGNDVNPLSAMLLRPRLRPPALGAVAERLESLALGEGGELPEELLVFFHPQTLAAICALRRYLLERDAAGRLDAVDDWIRMVAVNRLTGHSPGFFSVYTLPPNQAASLEAQRKINEKRAQAPVARDVKGIVLKKSGSLLADVDGPCRRRLARAAAAMRLCTRPAASTPELDDGAVALVVTSPPFLDVVQYAADNWLRCWFCGIDPKGVAITMARTVAAWQEAMTGALRELYRVVRSGGHVAFEVGEVRGGTVRLEEAVIPCALAAGFEPELVLINVQEFTKTANCWGVHNNEKGTNSNRVVLLRRP
jgi:DNA methylase